MRLEIAQKLAVLPRTNGGGGGSSPITVTSNSNYVTHDQLGRQVDAFGESLRGVSESIPGPIELTDATIPDDITASNYLPFSGGTLTGALSGTDLTLSGTLTANALSVAALSSDGAVEGPYFTATSTTATSTFAGAIGVGTTSPAAKLAIQSTDPNQTSLLIAGTTSQASPLLDIFNSSNTGLLRLTAGGQLGVGSSALFSGFPANYSLVAGGDLVVNDTSPVIYLRTSSGAENPALDFSNDLRFRTGATTELMRLTSTGNLGIGTTTPASKLDVWGDLRVGTSSVPTLFAQSSTGRVGIATTTLDSQSALTVAGGIRLNTVGTTRSLTIDPGNGIVDVTNGSLYLNRFNANNVLLAVGGGNVGIGTTSPYAKLSVVGPVVAEYVHATSTAATSTFAGGITGPNNFVVQQSSGRVGIGTTTPAGSNKLHVDTTSNSNASITLVGNGSNAVFISDKGRIRVGDSANSPAAMLDVRGIDWNNGNAAVDPLVLRSNNNSTIFTVQHSGNTGVASTSPWAKLSVTNTGSGPSFVLHPTPDPSPSRGGETLRVRLPLPHRGETLRPSFDAPSSSQAPTRPLSLVGPHKEGGNAVAHSVSSIEGRAPVSG